MIARSLLNACFKPKGVNLGGGRWSRFRWLNLDNYHGAKAAQTISGDRLLPLASNSLKYVYSSHFFEHVDDALARHLFSEARRVLAPSGVIRISVPDFSLAIERYSAGDHDFFDGGSWGFSPRYENWASHGVQLTLENKLSFAFCGYENVSDQGNWPPWKYDPTYFCGPVTIDQEVIARLAGQKDFQGLNRVLLDNVPVDAHSLGHINWWTFEKFEEMLRSAGFKEIVRSKYRASRVPELRGAKFDNRPDISLYVEATVE